MSDILKPITGSEMMLEFITSYGYNAFEIFRDMIVTVAQAKAANDKVKYEAGVTNLMIMARDFKAAATAMLDDRKQSPQSQE